MIGFRVDANEKIATGHLMRCMAIAKGFQKTGEQVLFFLAEEKETERLKAHNIPYVVLHSQWNDLETEIPVLVRYIEKFSIEKLIVDSYQATKVYLERINEATDVFYMDDMAEETYKIAGVIHYSNWPWDEKYKNSYKDSNTICMAGMEYTPLRDEFYPFLGKREKRSVLLTTGGTDPYNVEGKILEYVKRQRIKNMGAFTFWHNVQFLVISGSMNQNKKFLKKLEDENDWITLYENINNMGELMRKSYVAVSAGGTTIYELCACEVPIISFSFANNQEGFAAEMGKQGILYYAGDARKNENLVETICEELRMLWKDDNACEQYRQKMKQIVDGKGVERIVEGMLV